MTLDAEPGAGASPEPPDRDPARGPKGAGDTNAPNDADSTSDASAGPEQGARRRGGGSAGLLGAAMLAVGEILEPDKTTVEIVQTDDEPLDDLPFSIDFGDLPPLD